ncbi:hypothetical protein [Sinomicrobium sp. M5D2P9]
MKKLPVIGIFSDTETEVIEIDVFLLAVPGNPAGARLSKAETSAYRSGRLQRPGKDLLRWRKEIE